MAGGNKAKGFSRKEMQAPKGGLRLSQESAEFYAQATKMLGGSICTVMDETGKTFMCHMRGKFRGRGKRDNMIKVGSWLLCGLREWESEDKRNCDLLEVYQDSDKERLKNAVPGVRWAAFQLPGTGGSGGKNEEEDIVFSSQAAEFEDLLRQPQPPSTTLSSLEEEDDDIQVDDI